MIEETLRQQQHKSTPYQRGFTNVGSTSISQRCFHVESKLILQRQVIDVILTLNQRDFTNVESTFTNQRCFHVESELILLFQRFFNI